MKRFPEDFMFQLHQEEKKMLIENYVHLDKVFIKPSLCFTEHGAVMLASVLNSARAIEVNVRIVRIFTGMREMLLTSNEILLKLEKLERKTTQHDGDIKLIFKYLKELLNPRTEPIGFRRKEEK